MVFKVILELENVSAVQRQYGCWTIKVTAGNSRLVNLTLDDSSRKKEVVTGLPESVGSFDFRTDTIMWASPALFCFGGVAFKK